MSDTVTKANMQTSAEMRPDMLCAFALLGEPRREPVPSKSCIGSDFEKFSSKMVSGKTYLEEVYMSGIQHPRYVFIHVPSISGSWMLEWFNKSADSVRVKSTLRELLRTNNLTINRVHTTQTDETKWYTVLHELVPAVTQSSTH